MVSFALLRLVSILLLVAANAFFVAAEFALVSVRDTRIQQLIAQKRLGARTVQRLHSRLDQLLSAVQFGVTLASLGLGWIGEPTMARLVEPLFGGLPRHEVYAHVVAVTLAFLLITYFHVTLGELVPKSLALFRAEGVALAVAGPMEVFMTIASPALYVFSRSAGMVLQLFGLRQVREGRVHSPEELKMIVTASRRVGLLPRTQEEVIHRALDLGNLTVREIMVPRHRIFSLPASMPLEQAVTRVVEEQHSRIPIYDPQRGPEHIIGVLYSKELSRWMHARITRPERWAGPPLTIRALMKNVMIVPETKPLEDLLQDFKTRRRHLAVVVDEFGSTSGVVTVEDVLEQIVGELEDEFDVAPAAPAPLGSTLLLDGHVTLRDLETQNILALPRDQGFETLAGFVMATMQRIPRPGDTLDYDNHRFQVLEMDGHRITKVKVEPLGTPVQPEKAGRLTGD